MNRALVLKVASSLSLLCGALAGCASAPQPARADAVATVGSQLPAPSAQARSLRLERLAGELPHLSPQQRLLNQGGAVAGTYRMCVGPQGQVTSVTPQLGIPGADMDVARALSSWRYRPVPVPVCFTEQVRFLLQ